MAYRTREKGVLMPDAELTRVSAILLRLQQPPLTTDDMASTTRSRQMRRPRDGGARPIRRAAGNGAAVRSQRAGSDGSDARSQRTAVVLQHIRELFRVSQEHFRRIEARCGVSGTQVWAAAELRARPGMRVSELAHALSIHLSTASNLLDRMEANALVRRARSRRDQRVVRVYLTATGTRMLRKAPEPVQGVIRDALDRMTLAGLDRLHRDLRTLLDFARVRDPQAGMKPLSEP